jgi:hypothetical protein
MMVTDHGQEYDDINFYINNPGKFSSSEDFCLMGCGAMLVVLEPMFRTNVSLPSLRWKESTS